MELETSEYLSNLLDTGFYRANAGIRYVRYRTEKFLIEPYYLIGSHLQLDIQFGFEGSFTAFGNTSKNNSVQVLRA